MILVFASIYPAIPEPPFQKSFPSLADCLNDDAAGTFARKGGEKYVKAFPLFADCLNDDAAGTSVCDQGGRELENFALYMGKTVRDLAAYFGCKIFFIGVGNTDQALFIYTCFFQAGDDRANSGFPGPAHGHKGNPEMVLSLCEHREKMQGAANPGGHVCDPSALAKIIKIGRDHIRYGRPGACPDLGDDLFCRDAPVPEPRCFYGHVS